MHRAWLTQLPQWEMGSPANILCLSRDTRTKFGELILVAMGLCRLIRFRTYVNRAAFLDDAKMDYKVRLGAVVVSDLLYSVLRLCFDYNSERVA